MTQTIEIEDVGPIRRVTIPLPEGGLVVLKGRNGVGKTKALEAVGRLLGGPQRVTRRDGATRGHVDGFGVRISVSASARRSGECEVESLEGKLDLGDLIDPGLDDPVAADRRRIKALLRLTGVEADEALFHELLGGEEAFGEIVSPSASKTDDLVEMAARIKRDIEQAARTEMAQVERIEAVAKACEATVEGVDLAAETDEERLGAQLEAAMRDQAALVERARKAQQDAATAAKVRAALAKAESEEKGPSLAEAVEASRAAMRTFDGFVLESNEALKALREAQARAERLDAMVNSARVEWEAANRVKAAVEQREELLRQWRETVERVEAAAPGPSDEDLDAAARRVSEARRDVALGALGLRAKRKLDDAAEHRREAKALREGAERLREAARNIDAVLSEAVRCERVAIREDRLIVLDAEGREKFYADLSDGERTILAAEIAADALRGMAMERPALAVLPQRCYQDMDPPNRRLLDARLRALHLPCLTAEADEGELRAEAFGGHEGDLRGND